MDEPLGSLDNGGVWRHRDCGFLKRAKLLEARDRIDPSGAG